MSASLWTKVGKMASYTPGASATPAHSRPYMNGG